MTPADLLARLRELERQLNEILVPGRSIIDAACMMENINISLRQALPDLIAALARAEKMEQDVTRLSAALCAIHAEVQKHFGVVQTKAAPTPGATDEPAT